MTIDEAIKHCEEVAEEQRSNAHVHEDMMVFKQTVKHNTEAEYHEESMNECIECAEEHRQLAEWLKDYKRLLEEEPCDDAINRQDVLNEAFEVDTKEYGRIEVVGVDVINSLLSVTPQQKMGHWIWQTEDIYRCSECGEDIHVKEVMNVPQYKCCPMCEAKMVERSGV